MSQTQARDKTLKKKNASKKADLTRSRREVKMLTGTLAAARKKLSLVKLGCMALRWDRDEAASYLQALCTDFGTVLKEVTNDS